jgi:hypothetical protein
MSYTKPEVILSGPALNAIQSQHKGMYTQLDSTGSTTDTRPTNGAYEADE